MAEVEGYDDLTVDELKEEAKERGLSGYSSMTKHQLVELLEADDESDAEGDEPEAEADDKVQENPLQMEAGHEEGIEHAAVLDLKSHAQVLKEQELATFQREVDMTEQRLALAKEHEPWAVDRLTDELKNARKQLAEASN